MENKDKNTLRTENLKKFLEQLGAEWHPDAGPVKVPKVWDPGRKQYNFNYFGNFEYVVILFRNTDDTYSLIEIEDEATACVFCRFNDLGTCRFVVLRLEDSSIFYEGVLYDSFGKRRKNSDFTKKKK